jgi:hypothetical protein
MSVNFKTISLSVPVAIILLLTAACTDKDPNPTGNPNLNPPDTSKTCEGSLGKFTMSGTLANIPISFVTYGIGTTNPSQSVLTIRDTTDFYGRFIEIEKAASLAVAKFDLSVTNLGIVVEDDPDGVPSYTEVTGGELNVTVFTGLDIGDSINATYSFTTIRGNVKGCFKTFVREAGNY